MDDVYEGQAAENGLPHHVTTPLLTLIMERALDEDYAHVAARRGAGHQRVTSWARGWTTALVVATFGAMATIVTVQNSRDAEVQELGRATLLREIQSGRKDVAKLQRQIRTLTDADQTGEAAIASLETEAAEQELRLRRLEVRTGYVGIRGPGVRIEVSSAPNVADPNDEIRDEDLALLVDGLFVAGAEAIAINDERIIALGGIRNTSRAIHVNGRPLTPPYVIEAIGDRSTLQARLLESSAGLEWFRVADTYGFGYVPQNVEELRIPAARLVPLRHAEEITDSPGRPDEGGVKP